MSLTPHHWQSFDGTPITGAVPTRMTVYPVGATLNENQQGFVAQAYRGFCDQVRVSAFPGGYHKRELSHPDGTVVVLESMQGKHRVRVGVRPLVPIVPEDLPKAPERFIFLLRLGPEPTTSAPNRWSFYNSVYDTTGWSWAGTLPTVYADPSAEFVLFSTDSELSGIKLEMGSHKIVVAAMFRDTAGDHYSHNTPWNWEKSDVNVPLGDSTYVMPGLTKVNGFFYGTRISSIEFFSYRLSANGKYQYWFSGGMEERSGPLRVAWRDSVGNASVVSIPAGGVPSGGVSLPTPAYVLTTGRESGAHGTAIYASGVSLSLQSNTSTSSGYTISYESKEPAVLTMSAVYAGYFNSVDATQESFSGGGSLQVDGGYWTTGTFGVDNGYGYKLTDYYASVRAPITSTFAFRTFAQSGVALSTASGAAYRTPPNIDPFGLNRAPDTIALGAACVYQHGGCILSYRMGASPYYISPGAYWAVYVPFGLTGPYTYPENSRVRVPISAGTLFSSGEVQGGTDTQPLRCVTPTQALWLWNPSFANGHYFSRNWVPDRTSSFIARANRTLLLVDHGKTTPRVVRPVSDMLAELAGVMGVSYASLSGGLVTFHQPDFESIQPEAQYIGL